MDSMPAIRYSTYIRAAPPQVYAALATGPGWQSWFATRAQIDLQARRYHFHWENFGGQCHRLPGLRLRLGRGPHAA